MSDDSGDAHLKVAVAMRAVRGALGLNQAEFADLIGVSKPTVARAETMEVAMRLDSYSTMLRRLKEVGVKVDTLYSEGVSIEFEPQALEALKDRLSDQGKRRQDRIQQGVGVDTRQRKRTSRSKLTVDAFIKGRNQQPPDEEK